VRCDVPLNVGGAPDVDHAIISAGGHEHGLVVRDGDARDWAPVLMQSRHEAALGPESLR